MSSPTDSLATVALPVFNGAETVGAVIESVLAQSHENLELVITDNASTDGTEAVCRGFAAADPRVVYRRHRENIGLLANFRSAAEVATGDYLRWIGDSDSLAPDYLALTLACFAEDERRVLVTTEVRYVDSVGEVVVDRSYDPVALSSSDPVVRHGEMLRLMTLPYTFLDPLYGLIRREAALVPRRNRLGEDQVFAAGLALRGPWGHVPQVLATRQRSETSVGALVDLLGVPGWHAHARDLLQSGEFLAGIDGPSLSDAQRRRARRQVVRLYAERKRARVRRGVGRVSSIFGRADG